MYGRTDPNNKREKYPLKSKKGEGLSIIIQEKMIPVLYVPPQFR